MSVIVELLKPLVLQYLTSEGARRLLIEVLEKLVSQTDNEVDDALVAGLARALRVED